MFAFFQTHLAIKKKVNSHAVEGHSSGLKQLLQTWCPHWYLPSVTAIRVVWPGHKEIKTTNQWRPPSEWTQHTLGHYRRKLLWNCHDVIVMAVFSFSIPWFLCHCSTLSNGISILWCWAVPHILRMLEAAVSKHRLGSDCCIFGPQTTDWPVSDITDVLVCYILENSNCRYFKMEKEKSCQQTSLAHFFRIGFKTNPNVMMCHIKKGEIFLEFWALPAFRLDSKVNKIQL